MAYHVDLKDAIEELREMGEGSLYGLAIDVWNKDEPTENLPNYTLFELCYCTSEAEAKRTMASFDNERGIAKVFELPNAKGNSPEVGGICCLYCEKSATVTSEDYNFDADGFNPLEDGSVSEYYSASFYVKKDDGTFEQTSA